jgi:hypothetical protein
MQFDDFCKRKVESFSEGNKNVEVKKSRWLLAQQYGWYF